MYEELEDNFNNTIYRCTVGASTLSCGSIGSLVTKQVIVNFAVPPNDDRTLFAVGVRNTDNYQDPIVYYYDGSSWKNITVKGSVLDTAPLGGAIAFISKGSINTVAVATSQGILVPTGGDVGTASQEWTVIANGLPVVTMMDMVYDPTDDRLVIATMGRGIWYVESVSQLVADNLTARRFGWLLGRSNLRG